MKRWLVGCMLAFVALAGLARAEETTGTVFGTQALVEKWSLTASTIDDLRANANYPANPTSRFFTSTLDLGNYGDNYYLRVRGNHRAHHRRLYLLSLLGRSG